MRPQNVLLILFLSILHVSTATAGEEKNVVPSTLRSAIVYRSGAELVHTATAHLQQGNNEIIISDVSNTIDIASIRVGCSANVTIMSVTFSADHLKPATLTPFIKKLVDSIAGIKKELSRLDVLSKSDEELLDLLSNNKKIGSASTGVSVPELSKMMEYYRQKVIELRTEVTGCNERSQQLTQLAGRLESQIKEEEKKNGSTTGNLILQLLSPQTGTCDLTISYLTTAAHWVASYDLKVENSTDPLHILYKARLVQTSGIDWKHVKLSLSTAIPTQGGNAPVLKTWFLQFVNLIPVAGYANAMANTVSGFQFRSSAFNYKDAAVIDSVKDRSGDDVAVNERQLDAVFDIDIPYDVPGNGKEQGVVLKEYQLPCAYQYYSAPRLDKDAYLLGQLTGWEKLNLLPGEANIMVEGTYVGKSFIDPNSTQDTLNLTLGRDRRIVVKKEKVTDYSSVKFLGSNKKQVFTYQITVRNNKKEKVRMLLKDQYPVSTNKDIEEDLLESSGASVNKDTGILTWNLELAPGESRSYRISYSIKYPKDKVLNIN